MEWLIVITIVVDAAIVCAITQGEKNKTEYRYKKQDTILSKAERSFYGVLLQCVNDDQTVLSKVRIADVIRPAVKGKSWRTAFNMIAAKHFGFILCDKNTIEVLAAIELDDKCHNQKKQRARDEFVNRACKSVELPIIRIKAQRAYRADDIKQTIMAALNPA